MELIKIINARNVLDGLAEKEDMGAHLAYWMTKFIVKTKGEYEFYVSETRKIFGKFGNVKEDDTIVIPPDKISAFNDAMEALNKTDAEDPGIRFSLSEISSELKLSMKQMYSLLDFIDEEN